MDVEQISLELPETLEAAQAQASEMQDIHQDTQEESCDEACEETCEATQEAQSEMQETIEALNTRIRELEGVLAERQALADRMTRECEEFEAYFPEVSLRRLPDEVWTQVHAGVPLAAAYALYERGLRNQTEAAQEQNARNAAHLPTAPAPAESRYFSPAQVRAMSRREVRENYDRIFESMRHWQ
ncbi:MAG: hypothetical protein E7625_00605 [Ruminococcaceae bacterium]|nr:hypothetical protein [Oscillospiraceae bacterium]